MNNIKNISTIGFRSLRSITLLSLSLVLFSACKKTLNDVPAQEAAINVVNASPGTLSFNFFMNNRLVEGPALKYLDETGYLLTFHGTREFDASSAGTHESLVGTTVELQKRGYHTIFIAGENSSLTTFFTEDDLSTPPAGKAKVRFVHLTADAGSLSVGIKSGQTIFPDQEFKSASEFMVFDPGTYIFELKDTDGSPLSEASLEIKDGLIYTIWSKGLKAGTGGTPVGLQIRSIN